MARTTKPLTNTEVAQAKPGDDGRDPNKEYNKFDGGGLALRIKPNGTKLWLLNYTRPYTTKRTNIGFGIYPAVSLAQARQKRTEAAELIAQGIDPKEHRAEKEQAERLAGANSLEQIAATWFKVKSTSVTPNYAEDIWRSLKLHVFPTLGGQPIHKVTAPKTIETLKPVAAKGQLETIKRVIQRLNEVMVFAVNTGVIESNPLAGINKAFPTPTKNHYPTLKPDQLPELMRALTTANIKITTRCVIEWQLHTMVRPSEAASTRWDEIDLDNGLWNIPAERMKKARAHSVPLSEQAQALLEVMRPISGHLEHVFPADRQQSRAINEQTANMALKRMGFENRLVAHGMRALASTTLNEQGFDADVIEAALAHVDSNEVRKAYNRAEYIERRRVLMAWWSNHIEEAATGNMSLAVNKKHLVVV